MSAPDPQELGKRAEAMLKELGTISAEPGRLVRLFLTPEHRRAADRVAQWMRHAGMAVSEDALGTVRGRSGEGRRLLIGSHIDTVLDAGIYDGPLGVVAGILAVDHFAKAGRKLPFGIDVLAFGDEEGSRFPATLASSSACAGVFEQKTLPLVDGNGVTIADALKAYGKNVAGDSGRGLQSGRCCGVRRGSYRTGPGAGGEGRAARRRHRDRRSASRARHGDGRSRARRHRADGAAP